MSTSTSTSAPTIIDLKLSFLSSQIRALSQPLAPSQTFLTNNESAEDDDHHLRQKHIDDALHKLNERLRRYNRLKYGTQAQRHVAEQIDRLYWAAGERGGVSVVGIGEEWVERGMDYSQSGTISLLPPTWSEDASERAPVEAAHYASLQSRLVELNARREAAREKLESHKRLKALVDLFAAEAGVQENLVGRNGEVEMELERMRRLMVRVERGLGKLGEREGRGRGAGGAGREAEERGEMDLEGVEESKVAALLG